MEGGEPGAAELRVAAELVHGTTRDRVECCRDTSGEALRAAPAGTGVTPA